MSTLKRKISDTEFEYISLTGEDTTKMKEDIGSLGEKVGSLEGDIVDCKTDINNQLDRKVTIIESDTMPSGMKEGEYWLDTSDNVYQGTVFQELSDKTTEIDNKTDQLNKKTTEIDEQLAQTMPQTRSMGISILEYENYATKVGGIITDWQPAIVKALSDLALKVVLNKTLYFPAMLYLIKKQISLTSQHNGINILGEGYNTVFKKADGETDGWIFNIYDSANPIKGVSVNNIRLDGNKANAGNPNTTGFGIYVRQSGSIVNEHIYLSNIWSHDLLTTGVNIFSSNVIVNNIYSYDNGMHGIGAENCKDVSISDVYCYRNGQYGIDIGGGEVTVNNFVCKGNVMGGMKTSNGSPTIVLKATNGKLNENIGVGFQTTNATGATFFFDNIEANDNGGKGFSVQHGNFCTIGKLVAMRNQKESINDTSAGVQIDIPATITSLMIDTSKGYGLSVGGVAGGTVIGYLRITNCTNMGVNLYVDVMIKSGYIYNNCTVSGSYGIALSSTGKKVFYYNIKFGDTNATKKQTRAILLNAGTVHALIQDCDFTDCTSSPIQNNGTTTFVTRDNINYAV